MAGCRNATCVPRMPVRGVSSISRSPASRAALQRGAHVVHLVGDVVQSRAPSWPGSARRASPRSRAEAARRGSRRRRAARPRRPAPRSSRGARAACRTPRWSSIADSRSATATPMWSMRPNTASECTFGHVRIALVANRAVGRRTRPGAARRGAWAARRSFGLDELDAVADAPTASRSRAGTGRSRPSRSWPGALGVPLAVIPGGTANDFARAPACRSTRGGRASSPRGHGCGRSSSGRLADGRPFVNVASAGLSGGGGAARAAEVALGPLAYGMGAARAAATSPPLRGASAWTARWSSGGLAGHRGLHGRVRRRRGRRADPSDGELDVVIVPAGSRRGAWPAGPGACARRRSSASGRSRASRAGWSR